MDDVIPLATGSDVSGANGQLVVVIICCPSLIYAGLNHWLKQRTATVRLVGGFSICDAAR